MRDQVVSWLEQLEGAVGASDESSLKDLPYWLQGRENPKVPAGLEELVGSEEDIGVLGLMLLWLGTTQDATHLELVEGFVGREEIVASFPSIHHHQQMAMDDSPNYDMSWYEKDLSSCALRALSEMTGKNFPSEQRYQSWRSENPDIMTSYDYWSQKLELEYHNKRGLGLMNRILKRDPLFGVRLLVMADPIHEIRFYGMPPEEVIGLARTHLGDLALQYLTGKDAVPEKSTHYRRHRFMAWLARNAKDLLDPSSTSELERVMNENPTDPYSLSALAVLKQDEKLLREGLGQVGPYWPVLGLVMDRYLESSFDLIADHFFEKDDHISDWSTSVRDHTWKVLGAHQNGKAMLGKLVADPRFEALRDEMVEYPYMGGLLAHLFIALPKFGIEPEVDVYELFAHNRKGFGMMDDEADEARKNRKAWFDWLGSQFV